MRDLILIRKDGTRKVIPYKATPPEVQGEAVARWFVKEGWRPSEAAMHVGTMPKGRLRGIYQRLIMLGKITQEPKP
jgi:hypothetical protein